MRCRTDGIREPKSHWFNVSTRHQFPLILEQHMAQDDLDLGSCEEAARTSMLSMSKSKVVRARCYQQTFGFHLRLLAHSEEPVWVPCIGVLMQLGVSHPRIFPVIIGKAYEDSKIVLTDMYQRRFCRRSLSSGHLTMRLPPLHAFEEMLCNTRISDR